MNQENSSDILNFDDNIQPKLPTTLNVLTILTFIGCFVQLLGSLWTFFTAQKSYENVDKLSAQMNSENMPGWMKSIMGDPETMVQMITKNYENRIPILLLSLVAVGLCFYGALQMRKLVKQGFLWYTVGELLPFLTQLLFIGGIAFTGITIYFVSAIALLFILLYASQRKHLIH